jgi:hypothetical protein
LWPFFAGLSGMSPFNGFLLFLLPAGFVLDCVSLQ